MKPGSWATALSQLNKAKADKVPLGWKTSSELATEWHISQSGAMKRVAAMCKAGLAERKTFFIVIDGVRRWIPHYKPL
jgi:predicted transcriptional regulator